MSLRNRLKQFATHPVTRRSAWIAGAGLFVALCSPTPAHAQLDLACSSRYVEQLNSMMQSSLGVPLSDIDAQTSAMNSFTQNSVYPQDQLQQSQQMATGLQTQASSGASNRSHAAQQLPELDEPGI
jgi:hypothetical protein